MELPSQIEELSNQEVQFRDDFYRDGFKIILLSLGMIAAAIALLIVISLYFFLHQVLPVNLSVYNENRVVAEIPLERPYLHTADVLQWVSAALPSAFTTDFINYDARAAVAAHYFTAGGWQKYKEVGNAFMNHDDILKRKLFISAAAAGAPVVLNQGVVEGKYAWWVQMPVDVRYSDVDGAGYTSKLLVQTLVVRISTLNNLDGVAIENMVITRA